MGLGFSLPHLVGIANGAIQAVGEGDQKYADEDTDAVGEGELGGDGFNPLHTGAFGA